MNQLATMLDTDLTVDPRARAARTGTDAESGADFGQVLQGISKPGEATIGTEQEGRNSRHSKKGNIESFLNVSADPVVSTMPMAREVPTSAVEAITSEPASTNATVVNGTPVPAAPGAAGASVTARSSAAVSGQALRISLSRGEEMTRTTTATEALKPGHSVPVEALDGSGPTNGKAVGSRAGLNGPGLPATTAVAEPASGISKLSGGDAGRLGAPQHKLLASLEATGLDVRPSAVSIGDPTTWSIGAATREDPTSGLRQSVAPEATLTSPMGSEEWQMDLGTQLVAMIEKGEQSAVINLSPAELGPVQIDVAVREGEVSVAFAAQVADTRSAIEASLPRLRDMLAGEGLSLRNSDINNMLPGFSQQKSSSRGGGEDRPSQRGRVAEPESAIVVQATPNRIRRSRVDIYA